MSDLQSFFFESHKIRFVDGKPIANDVASALGYKDPASIVARRVDSDYLKIAKIQPVDGKLCDVRVLEDAGIYSLILSSHLPEAKRFQRWLFSEIFPSIRKTDSYSVQSQPQCEQPQLPMNKLALEISRDIKEITDNLVDYPCLAKLLVDLAVSEIMPSGHTLEPSNLKSVSQIAESLDFPVDQEKICLLGKFLKRCCGHLSQQLERNVDGQQTLLTCYPADNPEVLEGLKEFFS